MPTVVKSVCGRPGRVSSREAARLVSLSKGAVIKKLGVWLVIFLIALSITGVAGALFLDYLIPDWMSAHPLTAGVLSGTIGLPLTTLIALFLVDYFVERAESSRREPLIKFLRAAVIHDSVSVLSYLAPRSRPVPGDRFETMMSGIRHSYVESIAFDIRQQETSNEFPLTLPDGWVPFPRSVWSEDNSGSPEMSSKPQMVEALARKTGALKSHLQQLSEAEGDVNLLHFMHILEAECLQWVAFYIEKARDPEGFRSRENQTLDIEFRWAGAELLAGLLVQIGEIEATEAYRRDWVRNPRSLDDFWVNTDAHNVGVWPK